MRQIGFGPDFQDRFDALVLVYFPAQNSGPRHRRRLSQGKQTSPGVTRRGYWHRLYAGGSKAPPASLWRDQC